MQLDKSRLGCFFVLIGLVLCLIFFATIRAENPGYGFLLFGGVVLIGGVSLVWRNRKSDEEEVRFRTMRRIRQKSEERKTRKKNE